MTEISVLVIGNWNLELIGDLEFVILDFRLYAFCSRPFAILRMRR